MRRLNLSSKSVFVVVATMLVTVVAVRAIATSASPADQGGQAAAPPKVVTAIRGSKVTAAPQDPVLRGRELVINHACGECHGGGDDPAATGWLAGMTPGSQTAVEFEIGPPPCGLEPKAKGCFKTRPRNLTPDNDTGMGRFTERQLFNALRYGLRPENTPDVVITSTTPGQGNFPKIPHYLAPPMPWPGWRHMPDADLRAIAAYLKRGLKPVVNKVPESEGPPDFWASGMTPENIGKYPAPAFPTANETMPAAKDRARVLRGRQLVLDHDCAACHRGPSPDSKGWLGGITAPAQAFVIGPCFTDEKAPCFTGRPRNLTPDKETGLGDWTVDEFIATMKTGRERGKGRPVLPPMPVQNLRALSDTDIRALFAYLQSLPPVKNRTPQPIEPTEQN